MPRRLQIAVLLAWIFHGLFILTARYRLSYDAYTHMLFADHYANNWFSLWEPRWYTGFTVVSYPPLVHQVIAFFIPLLGFDKAYALISWIVTTMVPPGVYAFARIFTGRVAASYAALAAALLLPIYVVAYVFGQLPFLSATLIALFAAAGLDPYLRQGGFHNLAVSVALIVTSMAAHHATLMVQPFLVLAVAIHFLFLHKNHNPPYSSLWILIRRLFLFGALAIALSLLVVWPFWQWGSQQVIQTPIDHLSRHNFFRDPLGLAVFFLPLYGPLVILFPFLVRKWQPRFIGLLVSFVLLFLLGLGGTTPLPRLFFGESWQWLTYDRFAFWACLTLTPLFGILFVQFKLGWKNRVWSKPWPAPLRTSFISALTFSVFGATALGAWFWPIWFPTQPAPVDMNPIVRFLDRENRSQWHYLTFGFGNQYTHLNLLTHATTIDGSYHTARTLPELRESGVAEIDTSLWAVNGLRAIEPILEISGSHGVRWGFVNRGDFVPVLKKTGWVYFATLSDGVQVWENPNAVLPRPAALPDENSLSSFSWGVFPILALLSALSLSGLKVYPVQTERIIQSIHALLVGLIPISLCYWYFHPLLKFPHARVYFTYTDALFFFTDALMVVAVILWISHRIYLGQRLLPKFHPSSPEWLLLGLVFLCLLSTGWSRDGRISLYLSLHLLLMLLLILSLRDWSSALKPALFGLCMALGIAIITGFAGFALQSTAFLKELDLQWPGSLEPSIQGASVVQLADGLRILRAYGTLPHPNILGGLTLFSLFGPAGLFLLGRKANYPALMLFSLGVILLIVTFSRSAWLGLLGALLLLFWKHKAFDRGRLTLLIVTCLLTAGLALYSLRDLVWTRVSNPPIATEQMSTFGREWLTRQAYDVLRAHPWTGIGVGSFVLHLAESTAEGALIEPVHSVPLLLGTELGMPGLLLILGVFMVIALHIYKAQTPRAVLTSGIIAGLGIISLFDHYLWSLAPGRALLGLALGLWMGQINHES